MSPSAAGPFAPHVAAICVGVRDVERAVAFYTGLGLTPDVRSDRRAAVFQLNGVLFYLIRRGVMDPEVGPGVAGEGLISFRHDVREERDLEAILVRVSQAGGRVLRAPERTITGGRRAWFADPDGHRWELAHEPSLRRDEHGGVWLPPRALLEAIPTVPDPPFEPDTDDLGPALVTLEEVPLLPHDDEVTVLSATPVFVELEPDEVIPAVSSGRAAASSMPPPAPRVRTVAPHTPQPAAQPRPTVPKPRPPAPVVEPPPPRRWTVGRVVGLVVLIVAPLGGGALAWAMLRYALP